MGLDPEPMEGTLHLPRAAHHMKPRPELLLFLSAVSVGVASTLAAPVAAQQVKLPTTANDFLLPGTQPDPTFMIVEPIIAGVNCSGCHAYYTPTVAPFESWVASMMGQAARDPVFHAGVAIANQDANLAGQFCIRCHAPGAWLAGKAVPGDFSLFESMEDFDGVNCNFCHRVVNPTLGPDSAVGYPDNEDLDPDVEILAALSSSGDLPTERGNAMYVVDPHDSRRGPFADVPQNFHAAPLIHSPWHTKGDACGTCHDVSNPVFIRNASGQLVPGALDAPHPSADPEDMFPEQRTFSEWKFSSFPTTGVSYPDNRFGGNHPTGLMKSCQDCHMPDQQGGGCVFFDGDPLLERPDVPQHSWAGGNTWVLRGLRVQMGPDADDVGLTQERVDAADARTVEMLRAASDIEVSQSGSSLTVRVINQSGHKLPTGYPEGRRMWVNVRFYDAANALVDEVGAYNHTTATLTTDTRVYETHQTFDQTVAGATGLPAGSLFHVALNNVVAFDNRIPPRGFTNAGYASFHGEPVGATYADGQYWDDSEYAIPAGATRAVASLYFQTSSREYMEFLRDANVTNNTGQTAYNLWLATGRSAPIDMDSVELSLSTANPADLDGNGVVNGADLATLLSNWGTSGTGDINGDGAVTGADLGILLSAWG